MKREEVQKLLDDLKKGPLGKPQVYWDRIENIKNATELRSKDPQVLKKWQANVDRSAINAKTNNSRSVTMRKRREERGDLKTVFAYTLSGEFYKSWPCVADAAKELKCSSGNIRGVCRGVQKTAAGYIWKYQE